MNQNYPNLKGLDSEDADWNLDLSLDQVATIFAMEGWPLIKGPATPERLEKVINDCVKKLAETEPMVWLSYLGRLTVRRNPSAPNCLEISLDIGHLDFTEALEARDGSTDDED